jgi:hypothetical protein
MRPIIILSCVALALLIFQQQPKESSRSAIAQEELSRPFEAPPLVDDRLDQVLELLKVQSNELQAIEECQRQESEEIKQRLVSLEQAPEALPLVDKCECDCDCEAKLADLESRISVLELTRATVSKPKSSAATAVSSVIASTTTTTSAYQPRWQNYDGKSRMQHAVEDHGMDIRGKSQAQVLAEMDAYHDKYGPGHPVKSRVMTSNCPGGICPTGPSVQTRSSGSGWFLGKNLRR